MTAFVALLLAVSTAVMPVAWERNSGVEHRQGAGDVGSIPAAPTIAEETEMAIQQWWPEETWPTVRCLVKRESSGDPMAVSPGGDYGLLQLRRSVHWRSYDWERILEIEYNIAAGADIHSAQTIRSVAVGEALCVI